MRPAANRLVTVSSRFVSANKARVRSGPNAGTKTSSCASATVRVSFKAHLRRKSHIVTATHRAMSTNEVESNLVQYVVLRKDLGQGLGWPLGSICAQAAHASVAAVWEFREHAATIEYCSPDKINDMHKVVLEVKGETQLQNLSNKLTENGVQHKLWMEQPENYPTCLATRPYRKEEISQWFKKCNLAKEVVVSSSVSEGGN